MTYLQREIRFIDIWQPDCVIRVQYSMYILDTWPQSKGEPPIETNNHSLTFNLE